MNWIKNLPIKNKIIILTSIPLFLLFLVFYNFQFVTVGSSVVTAENRIIQGLSTTIETFFTEDKMINEEEVQLLKKELKKNKVHFAHVDILEEDGKRLFEIIYENEELKIKQNPTGGYFVPEMDKFRPLNIHRLQINLHGNQGLLEIYYIKPMFLLGFNTLLIYGIILSLIVSALIGFILSRIVVRPLRRMENSITVIREKGFKERMIPLHSQDEIGRLTMLFNQMMDELEKSYNKQKQFIEDASHELRTPITALEGHLSLLNRWGKKDEKILEESLQATNEEVKRLRRLVQELIELSRESTNLDEEGLEIINPVTNINTIIKGLAPLHPEFSFEIHYEEKHKPVFIKCRASHFEQVVLILLDNAIKYTEDQKSIAVWIEQSETDVIIKIKDQGIGIAKEEIPYVFDRFYRADKSRNGQRGGYGLGLSIAKRLVESYEGKIDVSSVEGEGTTFIISFPLIDWEE